jgi:hypothetical protein
MYITQLVLNDKDSIASLGNGFNSHLVLRFQIIATVLLGMRNNS